jgi:hypothetical protein
MSSSPTLPPPPSPTSVPDQMPSSIPRSPKEKIFGVAEGVLEAATKGQPTPLQQHLQEHYQRRYDEAKMYHDQVVQYGSVLATGNDPSTGQPLTDDQKRQYQNWYDAAMQSYTKAAGVDKQSKGALQKNATILQHVIKNGGKGGATQGGLPSPPQPSAQGGQPAQGGGSGLPAPPPPSPALIQSEMDDNRKVSVANREEEFKSQQKIREEQAKAEADAKAKAANPSSRPVMGPAISVSNARNLALQGKSFKDVDGNPIDLTDLPDSMGLKFVAWGGKNYYVPFSPNDRVVTVGNETYAVSPMDVQALGQGSGTDLGQHTMPTTSKSTDPATNQTTVTTHTPTTTGVSGRGGSTPSATTTPQRSAAPSAAAPTAGGGRPSSPSPAAPLDQDGHIQSSLGASPQVIEGANRLLDGADPTKDLPAKTRFLSEALARKYGWEQGRFTPKEQVMLKEANTFLNEAARNPSLSVLDDTFSSAKVAQVIAGSKQGTGLGATVGRGVTTLTAKNMTDQEAEFVRMYNQLVGTISGLSQLSRATRPTEATIERLMAELPNPATTKDSADGRARIARLTKEINVAMEKGAFTSTGSGPARLTPPPAASSTGGNGSVQQWERGPDGKPRLKGPN